ncbi:MAG TPA: hypothetical protein EYP10_01470, partial [Armatimonadetes bacterium]|nr:hypothetical protein [Armatimonadota bacterium]
MGSERYGNFSHSIRAIRVSIRFNLLLLIIALSHSCGYAIVTSLRIETRRTSAQPGQTCVEVVGGGAVLLRVRMRDEQKCYEAAERVVRVIKEALLQNATPADVLLRKVPG